VDPHHDATSGTMSAASVSIVISVGVLAVLLGWWTRPSLGSPRPVAGSEVPDAQRSPERRGRRHERRLDAAMGDSLDLLVIALRAGHHPLAALRLVGELADPAVGEAFADTAAAVDTGRRLDDAVSILVDRLGTRATTLADAIGSTVRTGTPLEPVVDRLADDAHAHRRRQAQAAARELPIRLSFPLVLCTLPAFALVTIAPMLVGALSSLRTR
jgi:tight adherence protein C